MLKINKFLTNNIISVTRYIGENTNLRQVTIIDKNHNIFDWVLSGKDFMKLNKFVKITDVIMF